MFIPKSENGQKFPMVWVKNHNIDLTYVVSTMGGLWAAIVSLCTVIFGFFLINNFMTDEANSAIEADRNNFPEGPTKKEKEASNERYQAKVSQRINYLGMYGLFDKVKQIDSH